MKIGIGCRAVDAFAVMKTGADYAEINSTDVAQMTEEDFAAYLARVKAGEACVLCAKNLIPGDMRLTGYGVDEAKIRVYSEKLFARLGALGVKTVVFGSGKAKQVPEGFPFDQAWKQLYRVAAIFANEAEKYGQTVVIEGLRRAEVNIVNTIEDVADYVRAVARPNVKMLADFYHMAHNEEDLSVIPKYADNLAHFHIATPAARRMPTAADADFVRERLDLLKTIGYDGTLSFEGECDENFTGASEMLALLRGTFPDN